MDIVERTINQHLGVYTIVRLSILAATPIEERRESIYSSNSDVVAYTHHYSVEELVLLLPTNATLVTLFANGDEFMECDAITIEDWTERTKTERTIIRIAEARLNNYGNRLPDFTAAVL